MNKEMYNELSELHKQGKLSEDKCPDFVTLDILINEMETTDLIAIKHMVTREQLWTSFFNIIFSINPFGITMNQQELQEVSYDENLVVYLPFKAVNQESSLKINYIQKIKDLTQLNKKNKNK